jgi:hypothetical protein
MTMNVKRIGLTEQEINLLDGRATLEEWYKDWSNKMSAPQRIQNQILHYWHVSGVPRRIITGSELEDTIYWHY